jgi:hypothetical protein
VEFVPTTAEKKSLRGNIHLSAEGHETENFSPVKIVRFSSIRTNHKDGGLDSSGIKAWNM